MEEVKRFCKKKSRPEKFDTVQGMFVHTTPQSHEHSGAVNCFFVFFLHGRLIGSKPHGQRIRREMSGAMVSGPGGFFRDREARGGCGVIRTGLRGEALEHAGSQ